MAEYEKFRSQSQGMDLSECSICGRKFMPESLQRHEPICAKTAEKRRKPFDSSKQRIDGTEIATVKVSSKAKAASEKLGLQPRKNNWRQKHAEFINTLQAARGVKHALENGQPLPPPPPPVVNPDYVQCPTCNRNFNETAAERHIPFCAEKSRRLPTKKEAAQDALQRNNARTQYKAPKLKGVAQPSESNRYQSAGSVGQHGSARPTGGGKQPSPIRRDATPGRDGYGVADQVDARKQYKPNSTSSRQQSSIAAAATGSYSYNGTGSLPSSDSSESISSATRSGGQRRAGARETSKDTYSSPSDGRPPLGPLQRVQQVQSLQQNNAYSTSASSSRRMNSAGSGDSLSAGTRHSAQPRSVSKFCHECGSRYCKETAAFCCDCGTRRMEL